MIDTHQWATLLDGLNFINEHLKLIVICALKSSLNGNIDSNDHVR